MMTSADAAEGASSSGVPTPVVVHLSGSQRGTTERLSGESLRIGTSPEAEIRLPAGASPAVADSHASLHRRGQSYELRVAPGQKVWVNGEPVESLVLASGDVLEVGKDGPVLRFRLYAPGTPAYKSATEVFSDCLDCARHSGGGLLERAAILLLGLPMELATQTTLWFRGGVLILLALLITSTVVLTRRSVRLEERLAGEEMRIGGIAELLERSESNALTPGDLAVLRGQLRRELSATVERVEALEARSAATTQVISTASKSIVFLQGGYGFVEQETGRPLRFLGVGPDGLPLRSPEGEPLVGLDGDGPVLEAFFTGTAFVATDEGLLLTNRHVALPWAYDESAQAVIGQGLVPVMRRFIGYLPGIEEPFDVTLTLASDEADVAVLRCSGVTGRIRSLDLRASPPQPGEEVVVLGYPTGIRALLARTDERLVDQLMGEEGLDFWSVARFLSKGGHIAPLASRGIVGQATGSAVVYDAETTQGGSGGPVLDLEGRVVAVTMAVVRGFGGSNLGVPARRGRELLARAAAR